jgi:hypothetical protein
MKTGLYDVKAVSSRMRDIRNKHRMKCSKFLLSSGESRLNNKIPCANGRETIWKMKMVGIKHGALNYRK